MHSTEPRKRSGTIHAIPHHSDPQKRIEFENPEMASDVSTTSSDWNPALVSRRASVPMEIIIGGNGKPIFTASPSSTVGSPVLTDRRMAGEKEKKKTEGRSGSKKRSTSQKKKTTTTTVTSQKTTKKGEISEKAKEKDRESSEESPTSQISNSLATCFIGAPMTRQKQIEHLPEYEVLRKELLVTVRDAVIQTDLF